MQAIKDDVLAERQGRALASICAIDHQYFGADTAGCCDAALGLSLLREKRN